MKNYIKKQIKKTGTYKVLEIENDKLKNQVHKLNENNAKLKNQAHKLNENNAKLKNQAHKLNENNAKLKNQAHKLNENNAKLKNQAHKLNENNAKLKKRIYSLKWKQPYFKLLKNTLKAETKSLKQIFVEKEQSISSDYDKLTVIIPYRKTDDPEREENVDINLNYLNKIGIKNVIISEYAEFSSKADLIKKYESLFDSFKVIFTKTDLKLFNKAVATNKGVIESKTPYFAVSDIDSLTERKNFDLALHLLDKGFDVVYPFNRMIKDITDKKTFTKDYDFKKVNSPTQNRDFADGGLVFWNKQSFIDIGMQNEYFSGWGGEDNEILIRANLCHLKQFRIDNTLYHLYHIPDQTRTENNIKQFEKMMHIKNKKELLEKISQWPWLKEVEKRN